ncbi:cytochrome P450 family protein [Rhizoctonia solani]|uniref:Cytochrome P450 family protein n=1 Tax=Rhizoctonia solani TaxID=456999 RepID=A0A8H8P2C9_9AGAM|nr:cytochrome P450 family protein [Rhizoctonia solani]QRW23885.1 cytochrome P450 family protein [Rhizoctonia solani]
MGHRHRLVWLTSLARFIGYPAFALTAALRLARPARIPESKLLLSVLYVLAVPTFWGFRNVVRDRLREREAKRLGARVVPRVKGKWPGNIDIMLKLVKSLHGSYVASVLDELSKEYGNTFNMRLLWDDMASLPPSLLHNHNHLCFNSFGKGPKQQARLEGLLGDGIFNRDGDLWKFHRNMTRPFFVRERISEFDLFDKYAQKFLARMEEHTDTGANGHPGSLCESTFGDSLSLSHYLFYFWIQARLTIDAACEFLFSSTSVNTLSLPLPTAYKAEMGARGTAAPTSYGSFVSAFDEAQGIIPIRGRMGPVVNEWVAPLLESAIERRKEYLQNGGEKGQPAGDTFIDDLVSSTDDKMLVMDELVNILLAARDTHSNVLKTLRGEILEHVGPDAAPTYDQIKAMKYRASFLLYSAPHLGKDQRVYAVRAVLNETLRLFPPVPINERATYATCTIPTSSSGRLYIPSGVQVLFSPLVMQRRQDLWGADAWEFDPARWLDERNEMFIKDPMRFVPFNAGPRICLGQQFAYNEASFVLVRVLQRFDTLQLAMDAAPAGSIPPSQWQGQSGRASVEKVWPKNAVTLYSKGGIHHPHPSSSTGSNYLDALALRISEAAGKAIAPPTPLHNSDGLLLHGRRPLPSGRGRLLGQLIQSEIHTAAQAGHDLLRASLRALHRPLNVLLTNVSTLLAPLVVLPPTNVLVPSSPWVQLGASQAHALGLATLVAELLASLDALPGDCAKPVLTAVRTELVALVDALEQAPLGGGKKDNPLAGPVAPGAIAACEIAVVWRAMVALAHRKIDPNSTKPLSTKSSGPLKSSSPTNKPKSTLPRRLTPPSTPPPARFLLPTSRPPSPPTSISPSVQLANDAKIVLSLLDGMPRPAGDDAKEADMLVRLIDGERRSSCHHQLSQIQHPAPVLDLVRHINFLGRRRAPGPAGHPHPLARHVRCRLLEIDEAAYRERCLSGFGRAEASEGVVVRAVLARLEEQHAVDARVPAWVKAWMKTRAED